MSLQPAAALLLDLLGTARTVDPARLAALDGAGWQALDGMAARHRLAPLLHARHRDTMGIPAGIAAGWREAHRLAAITAMAQHADLRAASALLAAHGMAPVALKGAWLAWHAYPAAAQRPMRDIDLLVRREHALEAFAILRGAGYAIDHDAKIPLAEFARVELHMPVLISPRGTVLELHTRVSEADGKLEYRTPEGNENSILAHAVLVDGLRYPQPADMLEHLVNHAVYGHRFDCGPLVLTDILHLAARGGIDWDGFWDKAHAGRWQGGARLVIELVRRYHGEGAVPRARGEPARPPGDVVDLAAGLLLQNWETKKTARFVATILTGGWKTVFARIAGKVETGEQDTLTIDRKGEGGAFRWAGAQLRQIAGDLADPAVRRQTMQLARFRRWLDR